MQPEESMDIDIEDRNDIDINANVNDDVSIASISYNDLQSESNSKAHSMSFDFNAKQQEFNPSNNLHQGLAGNINPNELQQHMQLAGKGGVDYFDSIRLHKFDNRKLNWEREGLVKKVDEDKKEEKRKKAQRLYNFSEEAEVDSEAFLKKDQKKKKIVRRTINRKKNKQIFNYNQFLSFSLFSNPDIILSNDFKFAVSPSRPFEVSKDQNVEDNIPIINEEEKIIKNNQFEDLNNYNNDNEEEGFVVDENLYSVNERFASAQKVNLKSSSNENRARLEQIYKIVNVRKIKSEIMNKLDNSSNKNKKPFDFVTLVSSMNNDNVNNKNKTYNEATCFVSLLHLCNEKNLSLKQLNNDNFMINKNN